MTKLDLMLGVLLLWAVGLAWFYVPPDHRIELYMVLAALGLFVARYVIRRR